jgi:hypothetical protein
MEVSRQPSHGIGARQWIMLTGEEQGQPFSLTVASKGHLDDIWRALLDAGVTPPVLPNRS